jgi:hypothetical protein
MNIIDAHHWDLRGEGFKSSAEANRPNLLARLEVQNLIREIGLIEDHPDLEDEAFLEPEMEAANDVATEKGAS